MDKICLYHNGDLDGFCSGAIWKEANPDGVLHGIEYGDPIPWDELKGKEVTIVDFCLQPWSEMVRLGEIAEKVTWIDHHKSAIDEYRDKGRLSPDGLLDTRFAACELTWMFYFPDKEMPRGVFLLGDYDCWRHSDDDTLPFQMGMRIHDMDPSHEQSWKPMWSDILNDYRAHMEGTIRDGHAILRYQKQDNATIARKIWFPVSFAGKKWMAVNRSGINSKFWDDIWDDSFDGCLSFVYNGQDWVVSLYKSNQDKDINCGAIAKEHGGGGHPGAAGFQCSVLPFDFPSGDAF